MRVEVAVPTDLPAISACYSDAQRLQQRQRATVWPPFTAESILQQIEEARLFRMLDGDVLAGVITIAYEDEAIWGELERGEHLYLHRLARSAAWPGRGFVGAVVDWGRAQCRELGRDGLRLDTWADNQPLISLYARHGFRLVCRRRMSADPRLPPHYRGEEFALLEDDGTP